MGACNPHLAYRALDNESHIGLLLPCNLVVQQLDEKKVEISIADPKAMFSLVDNPDLAPVAEDVGKRLRRVLRSL